MCLVKYALELHNEFVLKDRDEIFLSESLIKQRLKWISAETGSDWTNVLSTKVGADRRLNMQSLFSIEQTLSVIINTTIVSYISNKTKVFYNFEYSTF